jgi:predicted nucleic acid-binding protein
LPAGGRVYVDAQSIIYTVERRAPWFPVLEPLWLGAQAGSLRIVTSALSILECLVIPYRHADTALVAKFEAVFRHPGVDIKPILRRAAVLRAGLTRLRTPDAIHAATALEFGAALFVTNDRGFRGVPGLPAAVLADVLAAP